MRIAVWANWGMLNSRHRAYYPALALLGLGHEVQLFDTWELEAKSSFDGFDAVLLHQNLTPLTGPLLQRFREAGAGVVWDNDDDILNPPPRAGRKKDGKSLITQKSASLMRVAIGLSDVVTTPSEILADIYRNVGVERVQVVENYVPNDFASVRRRGHEGVVIGWVAANEHAIDLRELGMRDTLRRVLDDHPQARVISIGIDLGLERDRYTRIVHVPYDQLSSHLVEFDVAIAPMVDVPFNRARSNGKLKEYAALGVPWLASGIGPYVGFTEKQGGRLVADDDWYEEISRLVTNDRVRRKLAKRGLKWAKDQTIGKHVREWEAVLQEAAERARAKR